jgi:hypothetical protein
MASLGKNRWFQRGVRNHRETMQKHVERNRRNHRETSMKPPRNHSETISETISETAETSPLRGGLRFRGPDSVSGFRRSKP